VLLDHFHPPISTQRHWESFHTTWAGAIADALNDRLLPEGYLPKSRSIGSAWALFRPVRQHSRRSVGDDAP
jgi:hypothetical protein